MWRFVQIQIEISH